MNESIAEMLKVKIEALNFAELVSGLVRVQEKEYTNDGKTEVKRFPVASNVTDDCPNDSVYTRLSPDSSKKSIFYFEDLGVPIETEPDGNFYNFRCKLRLVSWLNLHKLGYSDNSQIPTDKILLRTMKALETKDAYDDGYFKRIWVEFNQVVKRDKSIFDKYSYQEEKIQYLMFPFSHFAIDMTISAKINLSCVSDIILSPEIDCNV